MAYAAVISLLTTMEDLANSSRISLSPPSLQILKPAYYELNSLRNILKRLDNSSKSNSRKKVNALDAPIKEAAWKFEDLLESHVYQQILPQSQILDVDGDGVSETLVEVQLQELIDEVDSFTKILKKKEEEYMYEVRNMSPEEEASDGAVVSSSTDSGVKMVGSSYHILLRKIRRELVIVSHFDVISVVGMAGIGKTTLAKKIFKDPLEFKFNRFTWETISIEFKFDCRAWVTIGRNYQLDKLQRDILIQLDPDVDRKLMEGGEKNEGHYLNKIVNFKRCLIVLDDVWDTDVWDHFKSILPEYISGRTLVLLTTRLRHVGRYAEPRWRPTLHIVELLNRDESWDLLRQRVFGEEDCPPQLEKAGKKIAKKCDGLPLMIITVADGLSKVEKTEEYWEKVAEDKNSSIFVDAYDQISEVLFPSYEYLPQHLKPCFLYMGVFPQSYEISKFNLLSMWIAEGFLDPNKTETTETCSVRNLGELIDHSLVIRCERSSKFMYKDVDEIKTCRLHSTFWHLCNREATKNKFFHALTTCTDCSKESVKGQRRLSMHNNILFGINGVFDSVEKASASTARSLLCYGPYYPYAVPICGNLRLLKVLDALQIRFYEFPIQVRQLLYLRYITLTYNGELPASISKLWNLQFLIVHRNMSIKYSGVTSYVPIEIWDMKELKHIEVMGSNLPHPSSGASSKSLLALKGVGAETCCTKEVLERIPNLRKLGIQIELHPDDDMKAFDCLDHVHVLQYQLRSLTCVVVNPMLRSEVIALPPPLPEFRFTLSKLHLSGLGYPWEYMSIIGNLTGLEVLKLRCYAFRGPKWEVDNTVFNHLRYLLIEETDLKQLKVGYGGFGGLSRLCLKHCYELKDVQWGTPLPGPQIEVTDCSTSTVAFANEMRSKYEEYNPERHRKVYVQSSWDDGKLR